MSPSRVASRTVVPSAMVVALPARKGRALEDWLKQRAAADGLVVTDEAARLLAQWVGEDGARLLGEARKAALLGGPENRKVGASEVTAIVGEHRVSDVFELTRAVDSGARLIGVNNRNLRTLQVDVNEWWSLDEALDALPQLADLAVDYCEQPLKADDEGGDTLKQRSPIPIYVDSPMTADITGVFKLHPQHFDAEARAFWERSDPFGFRTLRYVADVEESKALNYLEGPAIIISASGMCEAGRIVHHLRNNIEDERNTILIVGFQARNTLGRQLVEHRPEVRIFGIDVPVEAEVADVGAFSSACRRTVEHVFLVHGEEPQAQSLAAKLRGAGIGSVTVPQAGAFHDFHPEFHPQDMADRRASA